MNVGEIQVQGAPSLYLVLSSDPELPLLTEAEAPWGFDAWSGRLKFQGSLEAGETPKFFQAFLELKESEGLYGAPAGGPKSRQPRRRSEFQ